MNQLLSVVITIPLATGMLAGCARRVSHNEPPTIQGLRFTSTTNVVGAARDTLQVRVMAHNQARAARVVEWGGCPDVGIRAVPTADASPSAGWDSEAWSRATYRSPRICGMIGFSARIAPGDSAQVGVHHVLVRTILGDSLPTGRYRITARAPGNAWHAGAHPAGEVELRRPST